MIQTLALLILLGVCACGNAKDDASLAGGPTAHSTLTLIKLNNSSIISQLTTSNNSTAKPHRIIGGHQISISEAPWQCALIQAGTYVCGCSIINPTWILTAAHCVYGEADKAHLVRAGSDQFRRGGQLRKIDRVTYHGNYKMSSIAHDIAMLRASRPFKFNSNIQPVRMPTSDSQPDSYFISGWGTINEDNEQPSRYLRGASVNAVSRSQCANAYSDSVKITNRQICAQAPQRDSCQGDSGGALMSRGTQYGIVSFGVGCARPNYPGVYTNVYRYRSWILQVMQKKLF